MQIACAEPVALTGVHLLLDGLQTAAVWRSAQSMGVHALAALHASGLDLCRSLGLVLAIYAEYARFVQSIVFQSGVMRYGGAMLAVKSEVIAESSAPCLAEARMYSTALYALGSSRRIGASFRWTPYDNNCAALRFAGVC